MSFRPWVSAVSTAVFLIAVLGWIQQSARASEERPNIILIVVDALRPDHLGCYGYMRPTSPNIDSLAGSSVVLETAITQAPWTKGSFSSMFTSLYPFEHGATDWESVLPDSMVTLAELLSADGYSTMGVFNMIGLGGRFGVLQGFAKTVEPEDKHRNARQTTDKAIELIKGSTRPFFLVVHYFDVHEPYRPPIECLDAIRLESDPNPIGPGPRPAQPKAENPTEEEILLAQLMYDGCIRSVDRQIGRLVHKLEDEGILGSTLLIVTADHGEGFWEHGTGSHGANTYDETIRVPLIIHYPARFPGATSLGPQVAHVDLLPTITEIVGIDDSFHREGTSLVGLFDTGEKPRTPGKFLPSYATLCECTVRRAPGTKCIRTAGWKLIVEPTTSLVQLYNLSRDPGETVNLWGADVPEGESMLRKIKEVPGVELQGWRMACTGKDGLTRFEAEVTLPDGGRFVSVDRFTRKGVLSVDLGGDSTSLRVESEPQGLDLILFDVSPPDAPVKFQLRADGEGAPDSAGIGALGEAEIAAPFTVDPADAAGLPHGFETDRANLTPGIHIWWLSGESLGQAGGATELTPEEIKRLKALGYLQ